MSAVGRALAGVGRGLWDFLVGDTPEMLVATAVIVGLAFALRHVHTAAVYVLPLAVAAVLAASVGHGRRR